MIDEMLAYNRTFVENQEYRKYTTSKYPNKKIAILTCMDTRLVELLPAALGIRNGDVKLGVEEVMVIGHTDCGVSGMNAQKIIQHLLQRGVSQDHIDMMRYCGIDFESWLKGFDSVECSVKESVELLRHHPLMPKDVVIRGYIINTESGELFPQED